MEVRSQNLHATILGHRAVGGIKCEQSSTWNEFFSNPTYSLGYGRYSIFTDKWTSSDLDKSQYENACSVHDDIVCLDLKVPMLNWLKCSDFETCSWSDPSQAGNNNNGGNRNNNGGNPPNNNGGNPPNNNNNGGNPPSNNNNGNSQT